MSSDTANYETASRYYFGLGCSRDLHKAFVLLKNANPDSDPRVALMLAELYRHGFGGRDCEHLASKLFTGAAGKGYPLGFIGLGLLAKKRKEYWLTAQLLLRSLTLSLPLVVKNRSDPKLFGVGPVGGRIYLDRVLDEPF